MSLCVASLAPPSELFGGSGGVRPAPPYHWTGPRVIGLCGLARSGKSTAAAQLARVHMFERVRFAGPLKAMMRALGLGEAEIEGDRKEVPCELLCGHTPRRAMQWLGTEWGRDLVGPNFWVGAWGRLCDKALAAGAPVVAEDVRFPNEAAAIRARGGLVVRIERPGLTGGAHDSERQIFEPDHVITNDGDLVSFEVAIAGLADL